MITQGHKRRHTDEGGKVSYQGKSKKCGKWRPRKSERQQTSRKICRGERVLRGMNELTERWKQRGRPK